MTAGEAALPGGPPAPPRRPTARAQPLKKVEWPGQNQLIQGVAVVLIACLIVGVFLYGSDLVFKRLVEQVFVK